MGKVIKPEVAALVANQRLTSAHARRAPRPSLRSRRLVVGGVAARQPVRRTRQRFFREGSFAARCAPPQMPDCVVRHLPAGVSQVRAEPSGIGWQTDYPYAEINLTTRLSELTKTRVSRDATARRTTTSCGPPTTRCSTVRSSWRRTPARSASTDDEAEQLRQYLLKGGFLWVDDFWGTAAWEHWASQIGRVLPPDRVSDRGRAARRSDAAQPCSSSTAVPQITNIQFWRRYGGTNTSERGADSAEVHLRAIRDCHRRIMVLMTHNTDVADSWEREGEDPRLLLPVLARAATRSAIDVLLHAMTH